MICHKNNFVFVHIPRTGGTSIEFQFSEPPPREEKHLPLSFFEKKFEISNYFKFTFIRNPWDIVISKYLCPFYASINYLSGKSLLHFLTKYYRAPFEPGDTFDHYFDPKRIDFIGRFESRGQDLELISNKINFPIDKNFSVKAKENQKGANKKHYTEYYDDDTREIVAKKYAKDIEYFGYKFQG